MRALVFAFVLVWATGICCAQTLRDELNKASIALAGFSSTELAQGVNAASARNGASIYLVYMRLDDQNGFTGLPQAVRFEPATGKVFRRELAVPNQELCCGSPLGITFTQDYALFEFHSTPSASAVIVADSNLKSVLLLYGFGAREVAPDEVIFTESMIHFAPAHPERIMFANLRTGIARELYPPKGDPLRAAFAREHKAKMPPAQVCAEMNDPCSPGYYDEDVEWTSGDRPHRFFLRVSRNAIHAMKKDQEPETVLSAEALYVYEQRPQGWFYCGTYIEGPAGGKSPCEPNLPVEANKDADPGSYVQKVN